MPLKNKNSKTITDEFSKILTTPKRKPFKLESDRGTDFYDSVFQNFLKLKNIHHSSRFTDKSASIAERVIRSVRNLMKKSVVEKGNTDWLSELPSAIKEYKKQVTIHQKGLPFKVVKNQMKKKSIQISEIIE